MAASKALRILRKAGVGIFLSLTGAWLLVICFGGLLTLGVLSAFHLGVLLSIGCIGLCLCLSGSFRLRQLLSGNDVRKASECFAAYENDTTPFLVNEKAAAKQYSPMTYAPSLYSKGANPKTTAEKSVTNAQTLNSTKSYNPFDA